MPFWIAAGLSLANVCYGLLILPESLSPEQRVAFSWRRANPFGALVLLRSRRGLFGLANVNFLSGLAHAVLPSISVLYLLYRYNWDQTTIGLTLAGVGFASIVVQGGVVGSVIKRIGERAALMLGIASGVLGFLVIAFARSGSEFWIDIPLLALWGLAEPASLALMSRSVGALEQGRLQGVAFAIGAGREWNLLGAPFLIAALLLAGSAIVAWRVTRS